MKILAVVLGAGLALGVVSVGVAAGSCTIPGPRCLPTASDLSAGYTITVGIALH